MRFQIVAIDHEGTVVARLATCPDWVDLVRAVREQRQNIELRPGQELAVIAPDGAMEIHPAPIPPYAQPSDGWKGKAVKGKRLWESGKVRVTSSQIGDHVDRASGWVTGDSGVYVVEAYHHKGGYAATGYPVGSVSGRCGCPYWMSLCSHILALGYATWLES